MKYASIEEGERLYAMYFDGEGIVCEKEELKKWFTEEKCKLKIVKIRKLEKDGKIKIPIIKLLKSDAEKIVGKIFKDKKISLEEVKAKEEPENEEPEKKEEETIK